MKKRSSKKLVISPTVIRNLTAPELGQMAGAGTITVLTRLSIVPVVCASVASPGEN
jgi:hypothetical protein